MRREPGFLVITGNVLLVLTALALSWTAVFYATEAIYVRLGWEPHALVVFLVNAALGFIVFGIGVMFVGRFLRPKQHRFFMELLEALRRISRGDFQVNLQTEFGRLNEKQRQRHPYAQLVESINDMAANLQAMEELRQEFISNVSHEIGSPLTSISGFARALKNDRLDREVRHRYLSIIETECIRLSKLSDNLLRLANLDSDRQPFRPSPYRLDKQLMSLILACEPQWEEKEINMSLEAEEVEVTADEGLMSQVWVNLIHNAVKFTPQGGSVSVVLTADDRHAVVRIADTGPGIPEQDQPRIFERFYKADKSRNRSAGGSGLGLSIALKIVEMHRGTISVSSKPEEGAEFTVSLPLTAEEGMAN
ncbi:sensor histidine kinase [Paenibacillus thailandensis]|uniref:histidine kinase n=1 Tax=Paenibacillus thailandensis TaxID=393250 RepID=A0ABW5QRF4_9BACL